MFSRRALLLSAPLFAQSTPKPVPRFQVVPQPLDQVLFTRDGKELTRYYHGPSLRRPFLHPIIGPSGRPLTRMGHPHDPQGHSHHNSVWISHQSVNGINFWEDGQTEKHGQIRQARLRDLTDGDRECSMTVDLTWQGPRAAVLMAERRRMTVRDLARGEWLLLLDLLFTANNEAATFGQTPFGLIGVRMAKTIGVNDGGGQLRNSEGLADEPAIFRKPARWVDYSGPVANAPGGKIVQEGITLMDRPANAPYPSPFHVRRDGWMGVCLTLNAPLVVQPGKPLALRYGLYVHAGVPALNAINGVWKTFADEAPPSLIG
ncbi:MAG: PmoA family protein [Acidobacteriota bacterium]